MITPPSSLPEENEKKKWIDLVGQSVHTNDDHDLGNIEAVGNDLIVVRKPMLAGVHIEILDVTRIDDQSLRLKKEHFSLN
jgi:hypothetical protein